MTCASKQKLMEDIENEGLYDALINYDDYSEIDDPKFQKLYQMFLQIDCDLRNHLGLD